MAGPWEKYGAAETATPSGPWSKYAAPDQEREKIVSAYAEDIMRRNDVYGGIPQAQLQDPERLWKLATLEAERNGYAPPQVNKMDKLASAAVGYGQGGTFGFADELSGGVDFVAGTGAGLLRGEGLGSIESGKQAYSKRVEADRTLLRKSRSDNPVSTTTGELAGGIITYMPAPAGLMGTGARTTSQVAVQTAAKADKLAKLAAASSGARAAKLSAQSATLGTKAAKLSLPAKTFGEGAARFGGRVAEGVGKGIGYGAAYGGLYGFGAAEGNAVERLDETAQGALIGGAAGGVLSPAIQFIAAPIVGRIGYGMLTSADNKALDIIIKRAERSGTSLQKVQADFDAWAKSGEVPETLAELMGPNERSLLSALITVNRETREQAAGVFVERGRGEVNRLEDAFAKSFGASRKDYQKTKAAAMEARAKEAEPFYEGAYVDATTGQRKFLGTNETNALVYEIGGSRVAQSTLSTASDYADALGKRAIRDEIDDFAAALKAGEPVKPLSVEAADYIERGINRRYGAATKGEAQDIPAGLRGLRDRVRGIIDPSGLGDARATAAEAIRRGELLDEGLGIMSPTVDVDDVNRIMQGVPDAGIPAASVEGRTAYGVGASRAVANALRNVPDMGGFADATRKIARNPALREKLEAARPKVLTKSGAENKGSKQTKANAALDQAIERASDRAQFGVDMVGNSKTAFRQGDVEDAVLDDAISSQVGQSLSDLLITGVGGAGNQIRDRLARTIGNRLGQPSIYRPQINRAAATVLLATGDQIPIQLARIARRAAQRANTRVTMRGLPPPLAGGPGPAPRRTPTPSAPAAPAAGPIRASGFAGFGGKKPTAPPPGEARPAAVEEVQSIIDQRRAAASRVPVQGVATRADWDEAVSRAEQAINRQYGSRIARLDNEISPATKGADDYRASLGEELATVHLMEQGLDPAAIRREVLRKRGTNAKLAAQKERRKAETNDYLGKREAMSADDLAMEEAEDALGISFADFAQKAAREQRLNMPAGEMSAADILGIAERYAREFVRKGGKGVSELERTGHQIYTAVRGPIRSNGFSGLRTDAANAAYGTFLGGIAPAESDEQRLRNMLGGAVVGGGARRGSKMVADIAGRVGKPRNALAGGTKTAGMFGRKPKPPMPPREIPVEVRPDTSPQTKFDTYLARVRKSAELNRPGDPAAQARYYEGEVEYLLQKYPDNWDDIAMVYPDRESLKAITVLMKKVNPAKYEAYMQRKLEGAGQADEVFDRLERALDRQKSLLDVQKIRPNGFGGGGRGPRKPTVGKGGARSKAPNPDAIRESVRKIAENIRAKGINAKPQPPEMRVGKGMSKLMGIKNDPAMSMKIAADMLKAGRSSDEIWEATTRLPIKIEGRTILVRGQGSTPEEVQAAFWQEMAKPYSKRAAWAQKSTEGIFPIGPNSVARKPIDDRIDAVTKKIQKDPASARFRKDIWEEYGILVIGRDKSGQMVARANSVGDDFDPVALMDGKQFKSFQDAIAHLEDVAKLPRADQPEWYVKNFSEVLDAGSLRKVGKGEYIGRRAGEEILRRPRVVGLTAGGAIGAGGVVAADAEMKRRQAANR